VLLLPVPPGFLIDRNGEIYYASLNFNLAGEALPPADVEAIVAQDAQLAAGIVLFDMWVANKDRHNGNVAYDKVSKKTQIFDHSHTLMHHGREGLQCLVDQPAIPGHCVASEIASTGSFAMWYERIQSIPDYYIRTIAADVGDARFGLSQEDAQFCAAFLIERRKSLLKLLCENHELFPKMPSHEWSALKSYGVVP
jgi:hypothetical protein